MIRSLAHITAALLAVFALSLGQATGADKSLTVVELFTSQGCSSCPPADKLVGELSKRDDVLALSLHVDYWDYIGWKDPFARSEHTDRQRTYAQKFGLRYVYTPQMVIHGDAQVVGAKRGEVYDLVETAGGLPRVDFDLSRDGDDVTLTLPKTPINGSVEIVTVFFDRQHKTNIKRGENGGRTLSYYNVVRDMKRIALWEGEAKAMKISMPEAGTDGKGEVCAVILQMAENRRIIGARTVALDGS